MAYSHTAREKEIENRLRKDFFSSFDAEEVVGDIDFAVAIPQDPLALFEKEYLLWAEAKRSDTHDICESLVQLILTIGKARILTDHLPPAYLGAFDAEKLTLLPFYTVIDVFQLSYINWNVRPSDHQSDTFLTLDRLLRERMEKERMEFHLDHDESELRTFIRRNFVQGKSRVSKIRINKTNFTAIFQKWLAEVKPTINVNWEAARRKGIIAADFYLADVMSQSDNVTFRNNLYAVLRKDHYELDRQIDDMGLFNSRTATFSDGQRAHARFWNRYDRPPRREFRDDIVNRRDLLVPQFVREIKGSFFTPAQWVSLSQEYLAREFGDNWQEEYYIWDCAAGTGNLLANLTNKYRIWASTLDQQDVDVMHDRIRTMNDEAGSDKGANLLDRHVFKFDFLNDSFKKLPPELQDIINSPEERRKLIIYINPPYAEASNGRTNTGTGHNRPGLSASYVKQQYGGTLGRAANELFAQFFARIVKEIPDSHVAMFSTLKILQGPNFAAFRQHYAARLSSVFIVPASTFDNVKGAFPIGFQIWHTADKEKFQSISADVYDADGSLAGKKMLHSYDQTELIIDWLRQSYDKESEPIAYFRYLGTDFQHQNGVFITLKPSENDISQVKGSWATWKNLPQYCVYFAVRKVVEKQWVNNQDQFLAPLAACASDRDFIADCIAFTLFHGKNRVSQRDGINHLIPFTEEEVRAQEMFKSHFMTDFINGRVDKRWAKMNRKEGEAGIFDNDNAATPSDIHFAEMHFTPAAEAVFDAGRELWRYYHAQPHAVPDASLYDIRLHFQGTTTDAKGQERMNAESGDAHYMQLIDRLRQAMKALAAQIAPKVFDYGFLKRNYEPLSKPAPRRPQRAKAANPPFDEEALQPAPAQQKAGCTPAAEPCHQQGTIQTVNVNIQYNFNAPVGQVIENAAGGLPAGEHDVNAHKGH